MGGLSNIDQEGFASAAFHSLPQNMRWDTYSGDYGPNFFGIAANAGTYLIRHEEFGWQAFGGNVTVDGDWIKLKPLDAFRRRVFIAPPGSGWNSIPGHSTLSNSTPAHMPSGSDSLLQLHSPRLRGSEWINLQR
jgi:hypothetical protein